MESLLHRPKSPSEYQLNCFFVRRRICSRFRFSCSNLILLTGQGKREFGITGSFSLTTSISTRLLFLVSHYANLVSRISSSSPHTKRFVWREEEETLGTWLSLCVPYSRKSIKSSLLLLAACWRKQMRAGLNVHH